MSVTGNDSTGTGIATRPFRTIGRAAREIVPGTAIEVHSGAYDGTVFLTDLRGTAAQPIWIRGAPGERRPVVRGGSEGLHLTRPRFVVVEDVEVVEAADNGINVDDGEQRADGEAARFVVFRRIDVHDIGRRPSGIANCLKMAGVNDVVVMDSTFARCGSGPGSGAVGVGGVGVHRVRVTSNRFVANGFGGVQVKGGSSDVDISRNYFQNAGWRGVNMGGSTGAAAFRPPVDASAGGYEARRIRVFANIFDGSETAAAFAGCVDCQFVHNTVVNPSKWLLRILQEAHTTGSPAFARTANGLVTDNIFYFRRSEVNAGEDINVRANTDSRSFSIVRSVWYAHDNPAQSAPRLPTFSGRRTNLLVGIDPGFVSAGGGDFHLRPTSQAKAAGSGIFTPGADFDGHCFGRPPSLGALEFAGVGR